MTPLLLVILSVSEESGLEPKTKTNGKMLRYAQHDKKRSPI
jgi:hypothetical protein